jgi:hypothetical protein
MTYIPNTNPEINNIEMLASIDSAGGSVSPGGVGGLVALAVMDVKKKATILSNDIIVRNFIDVILNYKKNLTINILRHVSKKGYYKIRVFLVCYFLDVYDFF